MDDTVLQSLAARLGQQLLSRKLKMATAESCTGGWIAKIITDIDGSSGWFEGGIVSYSNALKQQLLEVPEAQLIEHGAVSRPVVESMACGVLKQTGSQLAVAVSGIAGPGGGTAEKPVGTVWLAWASSDGMLKSECCHFKGDRSQVRWQTVEYALRGLLDYSPGG